MHADPHLQRLGLDHAADERAVKRAYARELKKIDQEHDAAGFQVLRHAYEMALAWSRNKGAASAAQVLGEATLRVCATLAASGAPARDAETGENPAALAQAVFEDLQHAMAELVARGQARDGPAWRRKLEATLDDERLLNIAARATFELHVARLLANGWRSGHESLFVVARHVFGWENDHRRLDEFGQPGALLNQAIEECTMFDRQESGERDGQADAILRARLPAEPDERDLTMLTPHLRDMMARFPAWTAIIASTERIGQWIALEQALPRQRRRRKYSWTSATEDHAGDASWWSVLWYIFVMASMLWHFGPH